MLLKKKSQKLLKEEYLIQDNICHCGCPIPPMLKTYNESLINKKRIFVEHIYICQQCGKKNIIIG